MRITIPGWKAPICKCGCKMEIYVDLPDKRLRTKCIYCGLERYDSIPFYAGAMTLRTIYETAHSLME